MQGAYADKLAAKWRALLPLPDAMTYDQGAGAFSKQDGIQPRLECADGWRCLA